MRPVVGVALELVAMVGVLTAAGLLVGWHPLSILVVLAAQAVTTVLIHCPAHYVVGRALGIRFSRIRLGRSTMGGALPGPLRRVGALMVVFSLSVDPASKQSVPRGRLRLMYLSGVAASVSSAFALAAAFTLVGDAFAAPVAWLFALAYLATDVALSPKAGDVSRARATQSPPLLLHK